MLSYAFRLFRAVVALVCARVALAVVPAFNRARFAVAMFVAVTVPNRYAIARAERQARKIRRASARAASGALFLSVLFGMPLQAQTIDAPPALLPFHLLPDIATGAVALAVAIYGARLAVALLTSYLARQARKRQAEPLPLPRRVTFADINRDNRARIATGRHIARVQASGNREAIRTLAERLRNA